MFVVFVLIQTQKQHVSATYILQFFLGMISLINGGRLPSSSSYSPDKNFTEMLSAGKTDEAVQGNKSPIN